MSTVAEVAYAPVIAGSGNVASTDLLTLYTIESLLIGFGLASIYFALKTY
jgi:hypothetical protein